MGAQRIKRHNLLYMLVVSASVGVGRGSREAVLVPTYIKVTFGFASEDLLLVCEWRIKKLHHWF